MIKPMEVLKLGIGYALYDDQGELIMFDRDRAKVDAALDAELARRTTGKPEESKAAERAALMQTALELGIEGTMDRGELRAAVAAAAQAKVEAIEAALKQTGVDVNKDTPPTGMALAVEKDNNVEVFSAKKKALEAMEAAKEADRKALEAMKDAVEKDNNVEAPEAKKAAIEGLMTEKERLEAMKDAGAVPFPEEGDIKAQIEALPWAELKGIAKEQGIPGYHKMSAADMRAAIVAKLEEGDPDEGSQETPAGKF